MKVPKVFLSENNTESVTKKLLEGGKISFDRVYDSLKIFSGDNYADVVAELKKNGQRPFTFYENVLFKMFCYENLGKDIKHNDFNLFNHHLDSITGIAYKVNTTKLKVIFKSDLLENIEPGFNKTSISVDYDLIEGVEIDRSKGIYGKHLKRNEAKEHEVWLAVMGGDKKKLSEYVDLWFDLAKTKEGMGVHLKNIINCDSLYALVLNNLNSELLDNGLAYNPHFLGTK